MLCMVNVLNATTYSQNERLNVDVQNETMISVLEDLNIKTAYEFVYRKDAVEQHTNITIHMKDATIIQILDKLFNSTSLVYEIVDNIVVIRKDASVNGKPEKDKKVIKGKITDSKGNILPGASIVVKGTNIGVSSNIDGKYEIELPNTKDKITLIFTFIGMESKEILIKNQKKLDVKLKESKKALDEVVVTGFNNIKKEHFTGNATIVTKKEILKTNTKSVIEALQVFDPSFRIKTNNKWGSDPNALPEFNIRGESSIGMEKGLHIEDMKQSQRTNLRNNPNLPIFILDGFEVTVQKIYDMDINRIENITVLKDATATAQYGSRAANGVVMIKTVAPKPGELRVNYMLTTSVQLPDLSDYNLCNAKEKLDAEVFAGLYESETSHIYTALKEQYNIKLQNILRGYNTDWMAQPLKNAFNQRHSVYIEGGANNIRYGLDLVYDGNDGVMKGSYRDRRSVGFHLSYNYKGLRIKNKITYNNVRSENSPYGTFSDYARMQPYYRIYDDEGNMISYNDYGYLDRNPLFATQLESYDGRNKSDNITENLEIEYKLNDALKIRSQFSVQKTDQLTESFLDPNEIYFMNAEDDEKGELHRIYNSSVRFNYKAMLNYNKKIGKHFINGVSALEITQNKNTSNRIAYQGFQVGNMHSPRYAAQQKDKTVYDEDESRLIGLLGSINYSYSDIYLFDGSFRYDGSSKFGSNKRFAPFWSVGFGINIHKYEIFKSQSFLSRFKIRASYGSLGKVNFPSYTAITSYKFYENSWFKTGAISSLYALGNEDLKWETTCTFDGGIDLGFFNGRLSIRADYYNKNTVDLIADLYLRRSSGFEKYKINSGEITNKGYEISLNAVVLRTEDLIMSLYGNFAANTNEITKLSKAMEEYNNEINDVYRDTPSEYKDLASRPLQKYYVGASTTAIYAVKSAGIDPANGKEKYYRKDGTSTYTWNADDQVVVGDRLPDGQGSFGFNLGYKGFYVNASFLYEFGGQIYNETIKDKIENVDIAENNVDKRVLEERWKNPGDIVPYLDIKNDRKTLPSSRFVQDNDFIAFNSLSFGYDFKYNFIKKLGLSKMGIRVNMNDIARWSSIKVERGIAYPYARNYSLNLNLSF